MYEIKKFSDTLYIFEEQGVRSFLIIGTTKALLIDTGFGGIDFRKEIPLLTDLPVLLVNTHADGDHTGANALFEERYIHRAELDNLPTDRDQYHPIEEGFIFDLGSIALKVYHCPGHTAGSIVLYEETHKWLFPGDSISTSSIYMFGPKRDHELFIKSLQRFIDMNLEITALFPSHGQYPREEYQHLSADIIEATMLCIKGEPEASLETLSFGSEVTIVKRYTYGQAQIYGQIFYTN